MVKRIWVNNKYVAIDRCSLKNTTRSGRAMPHPMHKATTHHLPNIISPSLIQLNNHILFYIFVGEPKFKKDVLRKKCGKVDSLKRKWAIF